MTRDSMMINLKNILSVTDFQRSPKGVLRKLKEGKEPIILTVNGKAEFVLQDADSYQALLDKVRAAEDLLAVREGLAQSIAKRGRRSEDFFAEFEKKHGI